MRNFSKLLAAFALMCFAVTGAYAQAFKADKDSKKIEVSTLMSGDRYTFVAVRVTENGRTDTLFRMRYVVDIAKDTLIIRLPRLSGMDRIATGPDNTDHQYTNTTFSYHAAVNANGGWVISIVPRGLQTTTLGMIKLMKLNINKLGYGTLALTGTKHSISYYGYIRQHLATFKGRIVERL